MQMMGFVGIALAGYSFVAQQASASEVVLITGLQRVEDVFRNISRVNGSFEETLRAEGMGEASWRLRLGIELVCRYSEVRFGR